MLKSLVSRGRERPVVFAFRNRPPRMQLEAVQRLADEETRFGNTLADCSRIVEDRLGWSVVEALQGDVDELAATFPHEKFEPTLTSVQIAQVAVWRDRGIYPSAVVGVCAGEPAAAYAAGALTAEQAMHVACAISGHAAEAMDLPSRGGGFGAKLTFKQALLVQRATNDKLFAAMEWAPDRTLFAGTSDAIDMIIPELDRRGITHFGLGVEGFAAHSPLLDSLKPAFVARLPGMAGCAPTIPLYSGWRGGQLEDARFDAEHWWNVITDPVFVAGTMKALMEAGYDQFLEVSLTPDTVFPVRAVAGDLAKSASHKSSLACLVNGESPTARPAPGWKRLCS